MSFSLYLYVTYTHTYLHIYPHITKVRPPAFSYKEKKKKLPYSHYFKITAHFPFFMKFYVYIYFSFKRNESAFKYIASFDINFNLVPLNLHNRY